MKTLRFDPLNIIICGIGGQGNVLASEIVASTMRLDSLQLLQKMRGISEMRLSVQFIRFCKGIHETTEHLEAFLRNMLTSVFGISIKYEAWNHQDSLPVYIAGSYDFHTAYIGNRRCIMLVLIEELATLPALKKQIVKIQQIDNVPVVFELTTVSNY